MEAATPLRRRINRVAAIAAIAIVVVVGLLLALRLRESAGNFEPDCDSYSFDHAKWNDIRGDGREHEAEALVECGALIGKTREEVTAMLGSHDQRASGSRPQKWSFFGGTVNDDFGPGDDLDLYVAFSQDGRVVRATLSEPQ